MIVHNHSNNTNSKRIEIISRPTFIVLAGIIVSALNVLFFDNKSVSYTVVSLEIMFLLYLFMKKDITLFLGYYLIFLCLSLEFDVLVENNHIYGFKDFRIFGLNLGIISLIPVLLLVILRGIKLKFIKEKYPLLVNFIKIILLLNFFGVIWGLISILLNDNNINSMNGMLTSFLNISYNMILLPFLIFLVFLYLLSWEEDKIVRIKLFLIAILIGIVSSLLISLIFDKSGYYGGATTLIVSSVVQYLPLMLIIPFYKSEKNYKFILPIATLGVILALIYNAQGKMIIMLLMVPLLLLVKMIVNKEKNLILYIPFIILITFLLRQYLIDGLSTSIILESKFNQAISLLKFWEENWLYNLPNSPRIRVAEFISIIHEYLNKPWFFLMGKGYMGTITDHVGLIGNQYIPGSFEMNQWENGTFYRMHETLNTMFLYHGLIGVVVYFFMFKKIISNLTANPWIVIGGFWFLTIYGFSITISAFGVTALLLGIALTYKKRMVT